ncbi:MAG: ATP-binding cassette domain-containing protein, partial [Planctomycetaceae bacterium]
MTSRLCVEKICKTYAAPVLRDVSLTIGMGEIHALLGANGAGKSTLSRIIAGLVLPTSGSMSIDGRCFAPRNKFDAEQQCVQIVQQELNIVSTLSVAENIYLNRLPHRFGFVSRQKLNRLAHAALESVGLSDIDPQRLAGTLGVGVCQLVEIASALSRQCRLLILDEPTAALTASETSRLFERLRVLKSQGVSVIYITHRLEEVVSVCDRLTVLRDGYVVGSASVGETTASEMVSLMTGEEPSQSHEFRSCRQAEVAMRVDRLS